MKKLSELVEDMKSSSYEVNAKYFAVEIKNMARSWIKELKEKKNKCNSSWDEDNFPVRNNCPHWHEIEDDTFYSFCECNRHYQTQIDFIKENILEED